MTPATSAGCTTSRAGGSPDRVVETSLGSLFLPASGQPGSACPGKEICQGVPDVYGQAPTSTIDQYTDGQDFTSLPTLAAQANNFDSEER